LHAANPSQFGQTVSVEPVDSHRPLAYRPRSRERHAAARAICFEEEFRPMFAIVRTGGKQYRVAAGDKIVVDRMDGEAGARIALGDVLFTSEGSAKGLTVAAEIIAQAKAEKVIVFKKKRRHNYRRKNGHRQQHTILKIISVGASEEKKAAPKKEAEPKVEAAPAAVAEAPAKKVAAPKAAVPKAEAPVKKAPAKKAAAAKAPAKAPKE
jgi:large subunit ribosomal protein L21